MTLKVLTANRLSDGIAVWLDADEKWVQALQQAQVAADAQAEAALLSIGKRDLAANLVVDVNLIEVEESGGRLWPLRLRERIRAAGPTIAYADGHDGADPVLIFR